MKIKTIKKETDLKAGPYIRAVINCHGEFWMEYLILVGRVFTCKSKVMGRQYRQMTSKEFSRRYRTSEDWYLSSLSGELNNRAIRVNPFKTVLIPYSNKAWNYLKLIKNVRDFAEATNGFRSTDRQFEDFIDECERMRYYDEQTLLQLTAGN